MSEERQNGMADYRDLAAVLADADKHFTIDFQRAVLASLLRIEQAVNKPPLITCEMTASDIEAMSVRPGDLVWLDNAGAFPGNKP